MQKNEGIWGTMRLVSVKVRLCFFWDNPSTQLMFVSCDDIWYHDSMSMLDTWTWDASKSIYNNVM